MCFSLQFFFSMFISFSSSSATASPSIPCHLCFHIRWFTSGIKHCVYFTIFTPLYLEAFISYWWEEAWTQR
jgi:hypothetical protein